ncbi:MAG: hypothetical protein E6I75_30435 [Chloroflexi bacterium]|nr:MAG: hypothetical protein E6I75_30435 [Chloroflexota bacterium]
MAFAFISTGGASATFECQLDGASFAPCWSPESFSGLTDGAHTFAVRSRVPGSAWDPTPAMYGWFVDATPPTFTVVSATPDPAGVGSVTLVVRAFDASTGIGTAPTVDVTQSGGTPVAATLIGCSPALPQTGVSTDCTYSYTVVAGQDGPAAVAVSGADLAGNSATASHSFIVDTLPATISGAAAPPPNANGWNNTAVTVTFSCADAGVGIKSSPNGCRASAASGSGVDGSTTATWTLSAETPLAGISVVGTAEDNAGNTATATVGPIRIDLTPPTISASVAPAAPDGANGWYVSDVTATFDCADALSDMAPGGCASTGGTTDTGGTTSAEHGDRRGRQYRLRIRRTLQAG